MNFEILISLIIIAPIIGIFITFFQIIGKPKETNYGKKDTTYQRTIRNEDPSYNTDTKLDINFNNKVDRDSIKCPRCNLINNRIAQRCACGYDFKKQLIRGTYIKKKPIDRIKNQVFYIGLFISFLLSISTFFIRYRLSKNHIAFGWPIPGVIWEHSGDIWIDFPFPLAIILNPIIWILLYVVFFSLMSPVIIKYIIKKKSNKRS